MTDESSGSSSRRWRDKYLNLIEEHEQLQRSSDLQQDRLRRGLVMVSLLAEGQASHVDSALAALRDALKPEAKGMERAMNSLEDSVKRFEAQNIQQAETLLSSITEAASKLLNCPLPKPLLKRVKQIRKQARQELESWSGYARQLQHWAQVIDELATLEGYQESKSSWWQRWFASGKSDDTDTSPANQDVISAHTDPSEPEPGFSHIAKEVSDTLTCLLMQLVIPERLNNHADTLRRRLNQGLSWYELVPLLEDTTDFLLDCLGCGQQEFEQFLQNLDKRLQAIQLLVSDASHGQHSRQAARQELDSLVRDQVADIRSVVTGSGDLGELASNVRDHLTLIVHAMESYQEDEARREQQLTGQLQKLQARLDEMEQEASAAQQSIEEHKRRANYDPLTGLPNRNAYQQRLQQEMQRFQRYDCPLSLVIADVDLFKHINDNYGHMAGDKVLQLLAKALQKSLRDVDFIARYGGEEFVILMPETTAQDALSAAEKLRECVEQTPFNFRKERVPVTMSFGVSAFTPNDDAGHVFERADQALYQAKQSGRNRCMPG